MQLGLLLLVSFLLALCLSSLLPIIKIKSQYAIELALAILLWPFVLGSTVLLALALGWHKSDSTWIITIIILTIAIFAHIIFSRIKLSIPRDDIPKLCIAIFFPLIITLPVVYFSIHRTLSENDALEYMLAARAIYQTRSLEIYPYIGANLNAQGFYAQWTHPPLYPSLLYLTFHIADADEASAITRLVSPFFLITASVGISLIGLSISIYHGLIAAALYACIPLLAVGAENSSVDPLSASACIIAVVVVAYADFKRRSALILGGAFIGCTLLSHSQAILIPFITIACIHIHRFSSRKHSSVMRDSLLLLLFCLCIPGYFYLQNYLNFGAIVSDNPLIYQIANLDWRSYFEYTRQLSDWEGLIVYGMFKGLSRPGSFGLIYWIFLATLFFRKLPQPLLEKHSAQLPDNGEDRVVRICATFILLYFSITIISLIFGKIDLIKNDRYPLIISGPLAIYISSVVILIKSRVNSLNTNSSVTRLWSLANKILIFILSVHFAGYFLGSLSRVNGEINKPVKNISPSALKVMDHLSIINSTDAKTLTLRPADFYFGRQEMVTYSDDRILYLYGERDPMRALSALRRMGIKFIHVPEYLLPPVYRSVLSDIIADPNLTDLVFDSDFNQLYEIRDKVGSRHECDNNIEFINCFDRISIADWRQTTLVRIPMKIELGTNFKHLLNLLLSNKIGSNAPQNSLLVRRLLSEIDRNSIDSTRNATEFLLNIRAEGAGFAEILIAERSCGSWDWGKFRSFANFYKSNADAKDTFSRRFLLSSDVCALRFAVDISVARGDSYEIKEISVGSRAKDLTGISRSAHP